ncbi:hypothetical protein RFI_15755, partial [Reticulomyxa filosa]
QIRHLDDNAQSTISKTANSSVSIHLMSPPQHNEQSPDAEQTSLLSRTLGKNCINGSDPTNNKHEKETLHSRSTHPDRHNNNNTKKKIQRNPNQESRPHSTRVRRGESSRRIWPADPTNLTDVVDSAMPLQHSDTQNSLRTLDESKTNTPVHHVKRSRSYSFSFDMPTKSNCGPPVPPPPPLPPLPPLPSFHPDLSRQSSTNHACNANGCRDTSQPHPLSLRDTFSHSNPPVGLHHARGHHNANENHTVPSMRLFSVRHEETPTQPPLTQQSKPKKHKTTRDASHNVNKNTINSNSKEKNETLDEQQNKHEHHIANSKKSKIAKNFVLHSNGTTAHKMDTL